MSRSVKYIYRSQNLLMFNNHHGNANVQFRMKIRKINHRRSCSPKYAEVGHFQLLFLHRTSKKCTKMYNARARLFFCSVNLLFGRVLVTVDVVVCLRSLIYHRRRQNVVKTSSGKNIKWYTGLTTRVPRFYSHHILTSSVINYLQTHGNMESIC